ncbi:hypothetical protein [Actinocorallia populi]|uniref:hypothetical protein n=1 Tax=Actinocorallia populi TaxID=2079200 RepID=UPI0013005FF1|nr:hypothetical protein [Actinocorallia populi]
MQKAEIVVSKPSGPEGPVRTGELLARDRGMLTVRWDDDGSEERVPISATTTFMPRGSLRHEAFADPAGFAARLEKDAVGLFAQVLREVGGRQRSGDLKKHLGELGLDSVAVDRAWRRAQKRLGEVEGVTEANNAYRWRPARHEAPVTGGEPPAEEAGPAAGAEVRAEPDAFAEASTPAFTGEDASAPRQLLRGLLEQGGRDVEAAPLPAVLDLLIAVDGDLTEDDERRVDEAARVLGNRLESSSAEERGTIGWDGLAKVAARLPLTPGGGRSALLAAAFEQWPERITEEIWWRDVDALRLAACESDLRRLFSDAAVQEQVIAPRVKREAAQTANRKGLAQLLALPARFMECLPAEEVAAAFRRVSRTDPYAAAWLDALEGKSSSHH